MVPSTLEAGTESPLVCEEAPLACECSATDGAVDCSVTETMGTKFFVSQIMVFLRFVNLECSPGFHEKEYTSSHSLPSDTEEQSSTNLT